MGAGHPPRSPSGVQLPSGLVKLRTTDTTENFGADSPLFPTTSGGFPGKRAVVDTIVAAAVLLNISANHASGAPAFGGHSLRRGGAQYLARSGVEIWRIQALARHSSNAILGYIADSHICTLSTIASEAATGRALESLRGELRALQGEVDRVRHVSWTQTEVAALASSATPAAPSTPGAPRQARLYVQASHANGRVHILHQRLPGVTACGWVWCRTGTAIPLAAITAALPRCTRCFTRDSSPPTSVSSAD